MLKIIFGVLSRYEREGWIHPSILQFFCDLPFVTGIAPRVVPIHNFTPAAAGRNIFGKHVTEADADWVCMIDNDMHVGPNLLDTLKDVPQDADIVVPVFYAWMQNTLSNKLCWGLDQPDGMTKLPPGFHELTKCGTGVIFIKPEVFRALDYPYFTYTYNADGGVEGTEDILFCIRARQKGFKIYGNADVKVGHLHSVELGSMWTWAEKLLDTKPNKAAHSAS